MKSVKLILLVPSSWCIIFFNHSITQSLNHSITQSLNQESDKNWNIRIHVTLIPLQSEQGKIDIADYLQQQKVDQAKYWLTTSRTLRQWKQFGQ